MNAPIDGLLEGEPWIEYRTRRDLLGQPESDPQVAFSRQRMLATPPVRGLIEELGGWLEEVISSHKSAGQPFHKLTEQMGLWSEASAGRVARRHMEFAQLRGRLGRRRVRNPVAE
jgi:hypothetical protein